MRASGQGSQPSGWREGALGQGSREATRLEGGPWGRGVEKPRRWRGWPRGRGVEKLSGWRRGAPGQGSREATQLEGTPMRLQRWWRAAGPTRWTNGPKMNRHGPGPGTKHRFPANLTA